MVLKCDWSKLRYALCKLFNLVGLCLDLLKNCFGLKVLHMFFPLFRTSQVTQIGKEKIKVNVKFCGEIVRFYVKFSSKKYNIVDLNLLFAVSN